MLLILIFIPLLFSHTHRILSNLSSNSLNQIRWTPNGTNLRLFKISFSTFWLAEPKCSETDLKKCPRFVPFETNLSKFGANLNPYLHPWVFHTCIVSNCSSTSVVTPTVVFVVFVCFHEWFSPGTDSSPLLVCFTFLHSHARFGQTATTCHKCGTLLKINYWIVCTFWLSFYWKRIFKKWQSWQISGYILHLCVFILKMG